MSLNELMAQRRTTRFFDPLKKLDDSVLQRILDTVALTPSGFNLQPWRFIVVTSREGRERIHKAAYSQNKVLDAPCVVILCGDTTCWTEADAVAQDMVAKGYFPVESRRGMVDLIRSLFNRPDSARDSVMRDVMLAAMTLMLAATEEGIASAPMSGFDPQKLSADFDIPKEVVPVLLLALGHARKDNPPRATRKSIDTLVCRERWKLPLAKDSSS